jgi:hypothetical protein
MTVFYKKKIYLTSYYSSIFKNNNLVLICQLNNIKLLTNLRKEVGNTAISFKIIKNNMARKLFGNFLNSAFSGTTVCVYGNEFNEIFFKNYLAKNAENIVPVIIKLQNYLIFPNMLNLIIKKSNLENSLMLYGLFGFLYFQQTQMFNYLLKIYVILNKICQR